MLDRNGFSLFGWRMVWHKGESLLWWKKEKEIEVKAMLTMDVEKFQTECLKQVKQTIAQDQTVKIACPDGNAVLLSEEMYRGLLASAEIAQESGLKDKILAALEDAEFLEESEVEW